MGTDHSIQEYRASLALVHTRGLGPKTWKMLMEHYGTAREAVRNAPEWQSRGLARPSQAASFLQKSWKEASEREYKRICQRQDKVLLFSDSRYPALLRETDAPPLYLYYKGRLSLLTGPCVAMVGARKASRYGLDMALCLARDLSRAGVTVVSGFAMGIDEFAHKGGLQGTGSSVAVLGTGLDLVYPGRNKALWADMANDGLLVTEFSPGTSPDPQNFPRRNRIISGLSLGVVVVEAEKKSGSLITARLALEQNRDVFALPGQVTMPSFSGCHQLIRQGAVLVRSAEDVLLELQDKLKDFTLHKEDGPETHSREARLDGVERLIASKLETGERLHIDVLARTLGLETSKVSQSLLMLELKNVITRHEGMYYSLTPGYLSSGREVG